MYLVRVPGVAWLVVISSLVCYCDAGTTLMDMYGTGGQDVTQPIRISSWAMEIEDISDDS